LAASLKDDGDFIPPEAPALIFGKFQKIYSIPENRTLHIPIHKSGDRFPQGGLARTRLADYSHCFTGGDVQTHTA
jgi:hypothetical protein